MPFIKASPSFASRLIGVKLWLSKTYLHTWDMKDDELRCLNPSSNILLGVPPSSGRAPHLTLPHQTKCKVGKGGEVATGTNLDALIDRIEDASLKL